MPDTVEPLSCLYGDRAVTKITSGELVGGRERNAATKAAPTSAGNGSLRSRLPLPATRTAPLCQNTHSGERERSSEHSVVPSVPSVSFLPSALGASPGVSPGREVNVPTSTVVSWASYFTSAPASLSNLAISA